MKKQVSYLYIIIQLSHRHYFTEKVIIEHLEIKLLSSISLKGILDIIIESIYIMNLIANLIVLNDK